MMAMRLLLARERAMDYLLRVQLDDTKFLEDGTTPDPSYVAEFAWGKERPVGMTRMAHLAQIKAETRLLCQERLAKLTPVKGMMLAGEGDAL